MKDSQKAKSEVVLEVKEKLEKAKVMVLVDYRGLTVAQVSDLRRKLREVGGDMAVVKNTLVFRALEAKVADKLSAVLNGPTAVVFSIDEVSGPKVLVNFAKSAGLPTLKAGILEDRVLTAEEVGALALIPGREVLNGKLVGMLASQPTRLVWALSGNLQKLVSVLAEISRKKTN